MNLKKRQNNLRAIRYHCSESVFFVILQFSLSLAKNLLRLRICVVEPLGLVANDSKLDWYTRYFPWRALRCWHFIVCNEAFAYSGYRISYYEINYINLTLIRKFSGLNFLSNSCLYIILAVVILGANKMCIWKIARSDYGSMSYTTKNKNSHFLANKCYFISKFSLK